MRSTFTQKRREMPAKTLNIGPLAYHRCRLVATSGLFVRERYEQAVDLTDIAISKRKQQRTATATASKRASERTPDVERL